MPDHATRDRSAADARGEDNLQPAQVNQFTRLPARRPLAVSAILCGALAAAGGIPAAARPRCPAPAARAAGSSLERELRGLVAMPAGPPGAIAIVQNFGHVSACRAGVASLSSGAAIKPSDHVRLASTSKAFNGAVALALVAHHVLSLCDTIGKWLPRLPRRWGRVTLRQLLGHTSGLPDYTASDGFKESLREHPHAPPSPLELLHFVWDKGLAFPPGSRFRYSNSDNVVVALLAEAATHRTYNRLLSWYVYRPLHLTHTNLPRGPQLPAPYLHGYELASPNPPEDVSTLLSAAYAWASGGIVSTPEDLDRFIRGYAGARLFSRSVQARQLRFVAGGSEPIGPGVNAAGLGIFRYRTRCGTVYGHTGNIFGYTQFMAATLDGERSVTVSVTEQLNQNATGAHLAAFKALRRIEEDAVCAALA
jgi:D-alanyl-D-alanine carboxypeptidase